MLTKFPADIQETNAHIAGLKADAQLAAAHPQGKEEFCGMVIKGVAYDEKKTAGERLVLACSELPNAEEKVIGSYRGFELSLRFDAFRTEYQALLKGQRKYTVPLGTDPLGNIIRLDNSLNSFPERITAAENELTTLHQQQAAAQIEVEKPFPQEEELAEKSARLAELNAQLDVDEKSHEPEQEEEQEDYPAWIILFSSCSICSRHLAPEKLPAVIPPKTNTKISRSVLYMTLLLKNRLTASTVKNSTPANQKNILYTASCKHRASTSPSTKPAVITTRGRFIFCFLLFCS